MPVPLPFTRNPMEDLPRSPDCCTRLTVCDCEQVQSPDYFNTLCLDCKMIRVASSRVRIRKSVYRAPRPKVEAVSPAHACRLDVHDPLKYEALQLNALAYTADQSQVPVMFGSAVSRLEASSLKARALCKSVRVVLLAVGLWR